MKRKRIIFSIAVAVVFVAACLTLNTASVQAAEVGDTVTTEAYNTAVSMLPESSGAAPMLISIDRTPLIDDIYKYSFIFKVGTGDFDKIGIYRVVKERWPWMPITADKAVMMVHGFFSDFDSSYLMSTLPSTLSDPLPKGHCLGAYLAKNNIDVWGVDRRSTFVPDNYCYGNDCSFMQGWDTGLHLGDLKLAVKFARIIRGLTGSGWGKIFMLGHSVGGDYAYAYANMETRIPKWRRDLRGIIPVDTLHKFDPEDPDHAPWIENASIRLPEWQSKYDSGQYYDDTAVVLKYIASLAHPDLGDPGAASPFSPELDPAMTNEQFAQFSLSATYLTSDYPDVPYEHNCAGTFDNPYPYPDGDYPFYPAGLQYTNFGYMLDFALAVPSFGCVAEIIDREKRLCGNLCGDDDYPYDDYLNKINIPIYYVGAAGASGQWGVYTLELLGSRDKESLIVQLWPEGYEVLDYGHIDLLFADNAESLVWEPICDWIKAH